MSTYARVCRPCPHTPVVPPGLPPGSACSRSSSLQTSGCLQALRLYVLWVMGQLGSLPPHPPDRRCEDWETSRGVSSGTARSRRWRTSTPCHPRALPYSFSKHQGARFGSGSSQAQGSAGGSSGRGRGSFGGLSRAGREGCSGLGRGQAGGVAPWPGCGVPGGVQRHGGRVGKGAVGGEAPDMCMGPRGGVGCWVLGPDLGRAWAAARVGGLAEPRSRGPFPGCCLWTVQSGLGQQGPGEACCPQTRGRTAGRCVSCRGGCSGARGSQPEGRGGPVAWVAGAGPEGGGASAGLSCRTSSTPSPGVDRAGPVTWTACFSQSRRAAGRG